MPPAFSIYHQHLPIVKYVDLVLLLKTFEYDILVAQSHLFLFIARLA